jgi:M6 family metalloprotease-like protein
MICLQLLVFGCVFDSFSVPAIRTPIEVIQPDGTTLIVYQRGDEYFHYVRSTDGYLLKRNKEGFFTYAIPDSAGSIQSSDMIARNENDRDEPTVNYLKTINQDLQFPARVLNNALIKRIQSTPSNRSPLRSATSTPVGLLNDYPKTGTPKSLVILVNFSDVAFKAVNNSTAFSNMMNEVGYNLNGHVGSARDYYGYNSGNVFTPDFVVIGPVTVTKTMAYYGANDSLGYDLHPALMVKEACEKAYDEGLVDFSQFDYDNDGYVDNVYVFYAGKGEADSDNENTIWPHSYGLSGENLSLSRNGKRIEAYACSGELNGSTGNMTGIGTFTHEYGHILGLTDMYDVDYEQYNGEAFDLNYWSLMAYGAYNNNGRTPPCLTLPERYLLGWTTPTTLDTSQVVSLSDLGSTNMGYMVKTTNSGEYFLLENRQQTKNVWDVYLPYHGMLIYHIDLRTDANNSINYWGSNTTLTSAQMWTKNVVNAKASHQCCDIEEADNTQVYSTSSIKGDPFPGISNIKKFTDSTTPSMLPWNSTPLNKPITSITENNGIIGFRFMDFSAITKPPNVLPAKEIKPYSFKAYWNSVEKATAYYLDVFTQDFSGYTVVKNYLTGYRDRLVVDTFLTVNVSDDRTTYYYQVRATDNTSTTISSDSISLTTLDGTPVAAAASSVEAFTFRANWNRTTYATGFYIDVFTIDSLSGDTTWVQGYKDFYLTKNYLGINELEDQTTYQYRVRGTNGSVISRTSNTILITTLKASEILAYVKDKTIYLKGMDREAIVSIYSPDGTLRYASNLNHITVDRAGTYLVTAKYDGKTKHFKLAVP